MRTRKVIRSIAVKEFRHILRDPVSCLLLFLMPVIILVIFGYALSFELNHVNIAVLSRDRSVSSEKLFLRLDANPKIRIVKRLYDMRDIEEAFASRNIRAVVVAGEGLGETEVFVDAMIPMLAMSTENLLGEVILRNAAETHPSPNVQELPEPRIRYLYNPALKKEYMPVPGLIMMVFLLVYSIMLGVSVNREKVQGCIRLLRLTPMRASDLMAGKTAPYFLIAFFHLGMIFLVCRLFGIEILGNRMLFFGICFLFAVCCTSLGLLISACFDRQLDVLILCWIILFIPNVFMSGFVFPVSTMPPAIGAVARSMPGTAFIDAFRDVAYKGNSLSVAFRPILILAGETLGFTLLSYVIFSIRLR